MAETKRIKTSADYRDGSMTQQVLRMYENGSTPQDIQKEMGYKNISNIYGILNLAGIKTGRRYTIDHIDHNQVVSMKESGMNNAQIARELTISVSSVSKILIENGLGTGIRNETSEERMLPVPEVKKKIITLPLVKVDGKIYHDLVPMFMGYR